MNIVATTGLGLGMTMQMCGDTSSSYTPSSSSTGFSCADYEIMLDVEVELAQECTMDSECTQVLDGTGCGCETDDLIANQAFDTTYFYDLRDEALDQSCTVDFGTTCECNPIATPVCQAGTCAWE